MTSLAKPRKSFNTSGYRASASGTIVKAVDGEEIALSKLPLLRLNDSIELRRETKAELEAVRSLSNHVTSTGESLSKSAGVATMQASRKQRHDDAVRDFEMIQRNLYTNLEDAVLSHGRHLRETIVDIEQREDALLLQTNDPINGAKQNKEWLHHQHSTLENFEEERRLRITEFARNLDAVEQERANVLQHHLAILTKTLVDIALLLEPEVERLIDKYATDINTTTSSNRRDHADVLARLEKSAVAARKNVYKRWDEAEKAWRLIKHKDAVLRFQNRLDSSAYTNPVARIEALRKLGISMNHRHQKRRLPLLQRLVSLRPPYLTVESIATIRNELEDIEDDEKIDITDGFQQVRTTQEEVITSARAEVEGLRSELHVHEALKPAGKLAMLGAALTDELLDPSMEEFFRKVNGLKVELSSIATAAQAEDIMYEGPLSMLRTRTALLVDAFAVGPALTAVGKAVERTALLNLLDSMRTAKRSDMPGIVVKLHKLIASSLRVPGLPVSVTTEFESILEALGDLIEEIHEALVAGGIEVPQPVLKFLFPEQFTNSGAPGTGNVRGGINDMGSTIGSSVFPSSPGGVSRATKTVGRTIQRTGTVGSQSVGKTGTNNSSRSKHTRRTGGMRSEHTSILSEMSDPISSVMGQILPMVTIRTLQRRIVVVSAASDLSPAIQDLLKRLLSGCDIQAEANIAIDTVIAEEALPRVSLREKEAQGLLQRVQTSLEKQALRLREGGASLCAYIAEVATAVTHHATEEKTADEFISEELNGALDNYEDTNNELETKLAKQTKQTREAPNLTALEVSNTGASHTLDDIEKHYRKYAEDVLKWTNLHPQRISSALRVHRKALCNLFGLSFPQSITVDGEPIPTEDLPGGMKWTINGPLERPRPHMTESGTTQTNPIPTQRSNSVVSIGSVDSVEPSILEPFRNLLHGGLIDELPTDGTSKEPNPDLIINAAVPIDITYTAGADLNALNLGGSIVPSPPVTGPAVYNVNIAPNALAAFLIDAESVTGKAQAAKKLKEEAEAKAAAEAEAAKAAELAKNPPPVDPKAKAPPKKSKAELEAEAKAAEEAAAAAARAAAKAAEEAAAKAAADAEEARIQAEVLKTFPFGLTDPVTGVPLDPAGGACIQYLEIPNSSITSLLVALRDQLLTAFEQYSFERKRMMAELATARTAAFSAELDERLRRHWPRKGELEVSVRAPREKELIEHRQRLERHIRRTAEKDAELGTVFEEWVAASRGAIESTLSKVSALQGALPSQNNLAALQGIIQRCRQLRATFTADCEVTCKQTRVRIAEDTGKLVTSGQDFLKSCTYFTNGGEYDPEEVKVYTVDITALEEALQKHGVEREQMVKKIEEEQTASSVHFDNFNTAYEKTLKELSMREGLGPKYGAPRRTAGSTIRTAIGKSEDTAALIDAHIEELQQLLQCKPGENVHDRVPAPHPENHTEEELIILRHAKSIHDSNPVVTSSPANPTTATPGSKPGTASGKTPNAPTGKISSGKDSKEPATTIGAISPESIAAMEQEKVRELEEDMLGSRGPALLSVRIRHCVIVLRDLLYSRAVHLDALKSVTDLHGPPRTFYLPFLSTSDVTPGAAVKDDIDNNTLQIPVPPVHVPVVYPTVNSTNSLILPPGTSSVLPNSPPSPLHDIPGWLAVYGLNAPHTIKGPSPSTVYNSSREAQRFMHIVTSALERCKTDTRVIYKEEGMKLPDGDAGLPESLQKWCSEQQRKASELREFSHRRLRDQCDLLASILPTIPSVIVADVFTRSMMEAGNDNGKRLQSYRSQALALEDVRKVHVNNLRLGFGDPNMKTLLEELVKNEATRIAEIKHVILTARASAVGGRARHARIASCRLAHNVAMFLLAAEECLVREDLAALPGDEYTVPKKLGFKRLHKTLRRAGDDTHDLADTVLGYELTDETNEGKKDENNNTDTGAKPGTAKSSGKPPTDTKGKPPAIDTSVGSNAQQHLDGTRAARDIFAQREWSGLSHPDIMFLLSPQEAAGLTLIPTITSPPANIESAPAPPATAPSGSKTPKGKDAPPATTGGTTPAVVSSSSSTAAPSSLGAVTCSYTSWSRHAILERDQAYEQYAIAYREAIETMANRFDAALEEVHEWETVWNTKVEALIHGGSSGLNGNMVSQRNHESKETEEKEDIEGDHGSIHSLDEHNSRPITATTAHTGVGTASRPSTSGTSKK